MGAWNFIQQACHHKRFVWRSAPFLRQGLMPSWSTGTNNFAGGVLLEDLQLPSDDPQGGIDFIAVTQLSNPR